MYRLMAEGEPYCRFALADETVRFSYFDYDGRAFGSDWTPLRITAADESDASAILPDFGLLGTIPIVSEDAAQALAILLAANAELLPLRFSRRQYYALNVVTVLDALDEERSTLKRFKNGAVMEVTRFRFDKPRIGNNTLFRIPQMLRANVFVTEALVEAVRRTQLTGFEFDPTDS